jgi:hypothetical protein
LSNVVDGCRLTMRDGGRGRERIRATVVAFYAASLSCSSPSVKVSPSIRCVGGIHLTGPRGGLCLGSG